MQIKFSLVFVLISGIIWVTTSVTRCNLSGAISCVLWKTACPNNTDIITVAPNTSYLNCQNPLYLSGANITVEGTFSGLNVTGSEISVSNVIVGGNLSIVYGTSVKFGGNITVGNSFAVIPLIGLLQINFQFNYFFINAKSFFLQTYGNISVSTSTFACQNLTLVGSSLQMSNINVTGNLTILRKLLFIDEDEKFIQFQDDIIVGNVLITDVWVSSNRSPNLLSISLESAIVNGRNMIFQTYGKIEIINSSLITMGTVCLYHHIHLEEFSINVWNGNYTNISSLINNSITVGIVSMGSLNMTQSQVETSVFIIITQQSISIVESGVNTSARACRTNMGAGRGLIVQIQDDFCYSGSAGAGYGILSNLTCRSYLQYFMFLTHSFPYMKIGPTLSTGSGGYGYNYFRNSQTGAGGGILYIFAKQHIFLLKANITASGGDVYPNTNLTAGSGGVIYLYSQYLGGNSTNISAFGGSSFNNRGAGSGGMVKISYQTLEKQHHAIIWINVDQGYQPSHPDQNLQANGIFYGPLCPAGTVRWYLGCQICGPNTYNMISNQYCLECPKASDFAWDNTVTGIQNPWGCFAQYSQGPFYIWIVPGQIDAISIGCYIGLLILFVIFGVIIRRQIKKIKLKTDQIECDFQALRKEMKQEKILTQKLKKQKSIKLYELMYHIHRITVAGSNTYLCPWVLPLIPPESVKKYVLGEAFQNFASKFNKISQWTKMEIFIVKLLYSIYPLHWFYYDLVKKRKYRKLCNLLHEFRQYNLINNFQFEDKDLITLKFSKNKDYTSCYIDFFFYQKADLSYYNLSVPFIIYLSGEGNFIRPFYIEENDPFVKAMNFIVNRSTYNEKDQHELLSNHQILDDKEKLLRNLVNLNMRRKNQDQLKKFIINFNAISCTLDLSAPIKIFIRTLSILIEFINTSNRIFFNKVKVQMDLILMISDLHEQNIVSSSIHILSNKNEQFLQKVKSIIPRMNLNNEIDLKIGLFIYNPDQEIDSIEMRDSFSHGNFNNLKSGKILSEEFGRSEEDIENGDGISEHLLENDDEKIDNSSKSQSLHSKITRYLCLFRYFMLSHQITDKDRYTIKLWQSYLILTQTALVFVWSIKVQIPYIFINLLAPFIGIIWIVSDSYGFGKLFLILNAMNLLNELATLLVFSIAETGSNTNLIKIIVCQSINLILVILNMFVGSRSITYSKKLKNVQ